MYRQGDVLVIPLNKRAKTEREIERDEHGRVVLAHGEVTGHAHALHSSRAKLFLADEGRGGGFTLLRVEGGKPAELVHEEHTTHEIPAGDHEVRRQLEYGEEDVRQVAD